MLRARRRITLLPSGSCGLAFAEDPVQRDIWIRTELPVLTARESLRQDMSEAAARALAQVAAWLDSAPKDETAKLTVVLDEDVCPGLAIAIGERPLPKSVRQNLALRRLSKAYDTNQGNWLIQTDDYAVTGHMLAYALERHFVTALTSALVSRPRLELTCLPTMVWARELCGAHCSTGWLALRSASTTTLGHMNAGQIQTIDNFPGTGEDVYDWESLISRSCLIHAIEDRDGPLTVVTSDERPVTADRLLDGTVRELRVLHPFPIQSQHVATSASGGR